MTGYGERMVIAEDEQDQRDLLGLVLKRAGYSVNMALMDATTTIETTGDRQLYILGSVEQALR